MSWQCVRAAFESQLPSHRKITLAALAQNATADGEMMWAPVHTLARYTSKRSRMVTSDLAWLEHHGIIEEVHGKRTHGPNRERLGGRHRCPRYKLNLKVLADYHQPAKSARGFAAKPRIRLQRLEATKDRIAVQSVETSEVREPRVPGAETPQSSAETPHLSAPDPKDRNNSNESTAPPARLADSSIPESNEDPRLLLDRTRKRIYGDGTASNDPDSEARQRPNHRRRLVATEPKPKHIPVLRKLIEEEVLPLGLIDDGDIVEETKRRAAQLRISYNSAAVHAAVSSALGHRRRIENGG